MYGLSTWMASVDTDPDLQNEIILYLYSWWTVKFTKPFSSLHLQEAVHQQKLWWQFFKGCLVLEWEANIQQAFYQVME
jgi:hypothetical protein